MRLSPFLLLLFITIAPVLSQHALPAIGDPPSARQITVTQDEEDPQSAIVTGGEGSVFPNAFVVVQNSYTGDRKIVSATGNGSFVTSLYGQQSTPYWISAFQRFPSDEMIASAIGTTIYGEADNNSFYIESALGGNIPRYRMWGEVSDSDLSNTDSLDIGFNLEFNVLENLPPIDDLNLVLEVALLSMDGNTLIANSVKIPARDIEREEGLVSAENELSFSDVSAINTNFVPVVKGYIQVGEGELQRWENNPIFGVFSDEVPEFTIALPIILSRTGEPRDVIWSLLPDVYHYGAQGIYAVDEQASINARFPMGVRSQMNVLPPGSYALEPSQILQFPVAGTLSGDLVVEVQRPDGQIDRIEANILQGNHQFGETRLDLYTDHAGLKNYPFDSYGDYHITMSGEIAIGGQVYTSEGNYWIRIAESLYLSPKLMYGTSLEVGDTASLGVHLTPQLPADVSVLVVSQPFSGGEPVTQDFSGVANRYGYYAGENFAIDIAGMIAFSYQAEYTDAEGRLWSTEHITALSPTTNDSSILANGQRGIPGYEGVQQAWFDTTVYPNDDINAGRQVYFPYFSGDVAYVPDAPNSGIAPFINPPEDWRDSGYISTVASIVRPDGLLRHVWEVEFIPDVVGFTGEDTFNQQVGMGIDGIREGDYAFLFGGAENITGSTIYGALMTVVDEDESARILSPFMDDLSIYGQDVDLFFVPTAIRPAQVMQFGETMSIAGQVAPTLPAEIEVTVVSPSGIVREFAGVANAIGYFYATEHDFVVDEIGMWTVELDMMYRGETSLGQLERPFPQETMSFVVYVAAPDNPTLGTADFMTETATVTKTFALPIPEGWTSVRAFASITTSSAILIQQELTVFASGTSYTFNPQTLAQAHPNIELMETANGQHVADVLTLTLVMTGLNEDGDPAIRARTYSITNDITYAVDEATLR